MKKKRAKIDKKGKKNDEKNKSFTKKQKLWLILSGGAIGLLNGFFGGGGGMICVPILQKVLGLDAKQSHATAIAVIFPLSLISAFVYVINGYISSFPLLSVGLGVVLGGITGSFALKFLPPKAIRIIFAIIMFVGGIRLII
ncbi:MAG: sulfite exporter TauE/SafE family protein [Clostridia bacterium]|nr:sulfite exporter TauE/SafE family protein [Clostridia bacterium]